MKLKRNLVGVAGLLSAAIGAQAATTMNWQFTNDSNPTPAASFSVNPLNTSATANVTVVNGDGYYAGALGDDASAYGNRTGIWSIGDANGGSSFSLNLNAFNATSGATLNYTVSVVEFYGINTGIFPTDPSATYQFAGLTPGTPTHTLIAGSGGTEGSWYTDTWNFSVMPDNSSKLSLQISPVGNLPLLVDRIDWSVGGDLSLTAVPEPVLTTGLTAAGLLAFGWYRRSRKTA